MAVSDFVQRSLFDAPAVSERLFFLTNRFNLLEFLSSGLILPRDGIEKYYLDLLEPARGHIPLFRNSAPSECVDFVSNETSTAYPVLLEVHRAALNLLDRQGDGDDLLVAKGPIPMSAVGAIYFRSDVELSEHSARSYMNVPVFEPLGVQPHLFEAVTPSLTMILRTLSLLDAAPTGGRALDLADRVAGLKLTVSLQSVPADVTAPPERDIETWLKQPFASAAMRTFVNFRPANGWPALRILESLDGELRQQHDENENYAEAVATMRGVLRNERSLQTAAASLGESALAVLLVLLRPDPLRIDALGPETSAVAKWRAASLAGWLVGFSRLEKPRGTEDYRFVDEVLEDS